MNSEADARAGDGFSAEGGLVGADDERLGGGAEFLATGRQEDLSIGKGDPPGPLSLEFLAIDHHIAGLGADGRGLLGDESCEISVGNARSDIVVGLADLEEEAVLGRQRGGEVVAVLEEGADIVVGARHPHGAVEGHLARLAEPAAVFDLAEAGAMGCVEGLDPNCSQSFSGGVFHRNPIAAPPGFDPLPEGGLLAIAGEHAAIVGDDVVRGALIQIQAERFAPAADRDLVPAAITAPSDKGKLGVAGLGDGAEKAVAEPEKEAGFSDGSREHRERADIARLTVPVFARLNRHAGRASILVAEDGKNAGDGPWIEQLQKERNSPRSRALVFDLDGDVIITAQVGIFLDVPVALESENF